MSKTSVITKQDQNRKWYVIDATGVRLGRLASFIALRLQGKHKVAYSRNVDSGDHVIVINSRQVDIHPSRYERKIYTRHSHYPGGLRQFQLKDMMKRDPCKVIHLAVKGMLPQSKIGKKMINKLYIYETGKHEHEAQKPQSLEVT